MGLPILTVSSTKLFRRCAREYQFRIERGLVPTGARAHALRFGAAIHKALETWWVEKSLARALQALDALEDPFDLARARAMIEGYHVRWIDAELETIAVELPFQVPLRNPVTGYSSRTWELAGKIDAIARDARGRVYVVEHKSTSEDLGPGTTYWERLQLDSQVSTYLAAAEAIGYPVEGCLYDVIGKPRSKPLEATPEADRKYTLPRFKQCPECRKKNADPPPHPIKLKDGAVVFCEPDPDGPRRVQTDPGGKLYATQRDASETASDYHDRIIADIADNPLRYYARGTVVRLEDEELDAAHDTWAIARAIRDSQLANRWPRNPDACARFGRLCDYWPICTRTADPDDTNAFEFKPPHTELTEEACNGAD